MQRSGASTPTDPARVVRSSARKGLADSALGTRNLMVIAALAVVGLVFLIPLSYISPAAGASPEAVLFGCAILGFWVIPFLLPATVVRRPGAAMIAALIMGIVAVFTTPTGPAALVGNLIGGTLIEIPLALTLYRKWTWLVYLLDAAFFGLFNGLLYLALLTQAVGFTTQAPIVVTAVISAVAGGGITVGLTRLLNRAGVGVDRNT